jgi:acylphosphatase
MENDGYKSYGNIVGKVRVWHRCICERAHLDQRKIWNQPDGNVGAIVQGPLNKSIEFVEWCKEGPPLAKVGCDL